MKKSPVVHFEMPYEDEKRVTDFYTKVFGWTSQIMGSNMGNYVVVATAESDEHGRPKESGTINGGFFKKDPKTAQVPSVVISVDDIKTKMAEVVGNGGEVLGEPMEISGIGWYVSFMDSEGNKVSLLQPVNQG